MKVTPFQFLEEIEVKFQQIKSGSSFFEGKNTETRRLLNFGSSTAALQIITTDEGDTQASLVGYFEVHTIPQTNQYEAFNCKVSAPDQGEDISRFVILKGPDSLSEQAGTLAKALMDWLDGKAVSKNLPVTDEAQSADKSDTENQTLDQQDKDKRGDGLVGHQGEDKPTIDDILNM